MRTLNPTEEGVMAFAIVRGLLELLVARHLRGGDHVMNLFSGLADELSRDYVHAKFTPR